MKEKIKKTFEAAGFPGRLRTAARVEKAPGFISAHVLRGPVFVHDLVRINVEGAESAKIAAALQSRAQGASEWSGR